VHKEILRDESIQATMGDIEQEIAFHHECIVALRQVRAGYERILGIRREERDRVAAQRAPEQEVLDTYAQMPRRED
jgi:hypothetical protein